MNLRFEALAAALGFALSIWFLWWPGPYQMVVFTFVVVPLFVMAALFYIARVLGELRKKDVL